MDSGAGPAVVAAAAAAMPPGTRTAVLVEGDSDRAAVTAVAALRVRPGGPRDRRGTDGRGHEHRTLPAAARHGVHRGRAGRAGLAEQGTRLVDGGGVSDEVWANAARHYDEEQLMDLVSQIAVITAFNRMNVILRQPAGDEQAGQVDNDHGTVAPGR